MPPPKCPWSGSDATNRVSSVPLSSSRGPVETSRAYPSATRKRARKEENEMKLNNGSGSTEGAIRTMKRKRNQDNSATRDHEVIDLTGDEPERPGPSTPKRRRVPSKKSPRSAKSQEERRLRVFRKHAPQTFLIKLERARTQRMFVVDRTRVGTDEIPGEKVDIVGTTGNIYTITIGKAPSCSCPDARKGNQCKHIIYVLVNVLKAPEHLQYQLAFISSELREIFARAPPNPKDSSSADDGKRKKIEGDCPICFMGFEPETDEIVWCRAACGNNIHKACFEQWASSSRTSGEEVKCVYCRTLWEPEHGSMKEILKSGWMNEEGYYNVGEELGLPEERDYYTYHRSWGRRRYYPY